MQARLIGCRVGRRLHHLLPATRPVSEAVGIRLARPGIWAAEKLGQTRLRSRTAGQPPAQPIRRANAPALLLDPGQAVGTIQGASRSSVTPVRRRSSSAGPPRSGASLCRQPSGPRRSPVIREAPGFPATCTRLAARPASASAHSLKDRPARPGVQPRPRGQEIRLVTPWVRGEEPEVPLPPSPRPLAARRRRSFEVIRTCQGATGSYCAEYNCFWHLPKGFLTFPNPPPPPRGAPSPCFFFHYGDRLHDCPRPSCDGAQRKET